jgi:hypothetical protein
MLNAPGSGRVDTARYWAGFASLGAGLIHLGVVQEHMAEWWLYGVFFIAAAAVQIVWAMAALALARPPVPRLIAALNAAFILLWLVTRTTGIPVGPERGIPEAFTIADVICAVLEGLVVLLIVATVRIPRPVTSARNASGRQLVLMGIGALIVASLTTQALAATDAGEHARPHGEQSSH